MAHTFRRFVDFADVDAAGVVYYPRFFHYCHQALEDFLGPRAYAAFLFEQRLGFPAVKATCEFVAPLRYGDEIEVRLLDVACGRTSLTQRLELYRLGSLGPVLSARAEIVSVLVDLDEMAPRPIPPQIAERFAQI